LRTFTRHSIRLELGRRLSTFNPDPPSEHTERELELEAMLEWICDAMVRTWDAASLRPPTDLNTPMYFLGNRIPTKWNVFFAAKLNAAIEKDEMGVD